MFYVYIFYLTDIYEVTEINKKRINKKKSYTNHCVIAR